METSGTWTYRELADVVSDTRRWLFDLNVRPGDFLRVPGGHKHWSGGDKKEGALFYTETSGKIDLIPAK